VPEPRRAAFLGLCVTTVAIPGHHPKGVLLAQPLAYVQEAPHRPTILEAGQIVAREAQDPFVWHPWTDHLHRYLPDSWAKGL